MRKLITADAFALARFMKTAELKNELKPIFDKFKGDDNADVEEAGIEALLTLMDVVGEKKVEKAFYELLASPFEMTAQEVENLELEQLINNFVELVKNNSLTSFFNLAGRLNLKS